MRATIRSVMTVALLGGLILSESSSAAAGLTIGSLSLSQGVNPDQESVPGHPNIARAIARDFPLPPSAHNLSASNVMPMASVDGVGDQDATAFYHDAFAKLGWKIQREVHIPGCVAIIACPPSGNCVNLSAASPGSGVTPVGMQMTFFKPR